ncbi:MAG TPA: transcriptional repressor [Sulfurospirillum arcachonense]|nr:transcriptional repressor [Sulfurospirillum arcachonense]HIP44887.1 transcriptional repressor [Sulfurospirillum arcachonense]
MADIENMEYDSLLVRFKDILKHNNLKFTKQREVVLKTMYNNDDHFSPESLYMLLKESYPELNVGIATVYRTLNLLEDSDMVTSLSFGSSGKKFELGNKPHHDHMICKVCDDIIEFEDNAIEKRQEEIANKYGFKLTNHMMQLYGICQKCQKKQ